MKWRCIRCMELVTILALGCTGSLRGPASEETPPGRDCLVDGVPLRAIGPPEPFCYTSSLPQPVADGFRLLAQGQYARAIAVLEPFVGAEAEDRMWWEAGRMQLAIAYIRVDDSRAQSLLLDIVRTVGDVNRWEAAGWYCNQPRSNAQLFGESFPPCPTVGDAGPG